MSMPDSRWGRWCRVLRRSRRQPRALNPSDSGCQGLEPLEPRLLLSAAVAAAVATAIATAIASEPGDFSTQDAVVVPLEVGLTAVPTDLDQVGTLWFPFLEWSVNNPTCSGNPFDLLATVTFTHTDTGTQRTTEMFYDGTDTWKFRFTGSVIGPWTFTSSSADVDLNNLTGTVTINPNPDPNAYGFMTQYQTVDGTKWARFKGNDAQVEAFVPQLVMGEPEPSVYLNNPAAIGADIQEFVVRHGFNGFHVVSVASRWFDINNAELTPSNNSMTDPDARTFEVLEQLITQTHAAAGVVHIWEWGDEQRGTTPIGLAGGINGAVDQRLSRYIAARLGPLPGWSMGYGFDLDEWVSSADVQIWRDFMHTKFSDFHYLGGRPQGPNSGTDHSAFQSWNQPLDYSSYEHWEPTYDVYVAAINSTLDQPVMSEDRLRIREQGREKDYTNEQTRRGLYHSTLAGGVANIWANLTDPDGTSHGGGESFVYPDPQWIKTYSVFFFDNNRFKNDLLRANDLTDGLAMRLPDNSMFIFYKEDTSSVQIDLGAPNVDDGITHPQVGDGDTTDSSIGGRIARRNDDPGEDFYFYFDVADPFAFQGNQPDLSITMDYFDSGTATLSLQYDSDTGGTLPAFYNDGGSINLTGTDAWKQHPFQVTDAYFGNRQNGGADLRIFGGVGNTFYLDRVEVTAGQSIGSNGSMIQMDLTGMPTAQQAVAVDTKLDYVEIDLGVLQPVNQVVTLPYASDWVVVVSTESAPQPFDTVQINLGAPDVVDGITHPQGGDGDTTDVTIGGRTARRNIDPNEDFYFYFAVADSFVFQGDQPELSITVDYFDSGTATLSLQYDSDTGGTLPAFYNDGGSINLTGTDTWKQHTFQVNDAYFGNRQNQDADFRIFGGVGNTFYLDRVEVSTGQLRGIGVDASSRYFKDAQDTPVFLLGYYDWASVAPDAFIDAPSRYEDMIEQGAAYGINYVRISLGRPVRVAARQGVPRVLVP
jgi:hypothetical protein